MGGELREVLGTVNRREVVQISVLAEISRDLVCLWSSGSACATLTNADFDVSQKGHVHSAPRGFSLFTVS